MTERAPWSAAAISGFVLSLLGCTGVAAPLGVILGIVGIVRTRGGQCRGRGLAIAAVPISVVMGLLSIPLAVIAVFGFHFATLVAELPAILDGDTSPTAANASKLQVLCSDDFNTAVSAERLQAWLEQVAVKHGRLSDAPKPSPVPPPPSAGRTRLSLEGRFVNGPASITITFSKRLWHAKLDDIEVDGVSPRGAP